MNDLLSAILGKKHCNWCVSKEPTWWERLTDQDGLGDQTAWLKRNVVAAQFWIADRIPIWKLGEKWHHQHHIPDDDPRKIKRKWCDSKKIGDVVCDCRGQHLRIALFPYDDDHDSVELEDGGRCSLYHCCSEPEDGPDQQCHGNYNIEEWG